MNRQGEVNRGQELSQENPLDCFDDKSKTWRWPGLRLGSGNIKK